MFCSAQDTGTGGSTINGEEWRDIVDVFLGFFPGFVYSNQGILREMNERSSRELGAPLQLSYGKQGGLSAGACRLKNFNM